MAHREFTDGAGTRWRTWDTRPRIAAARAAFGAVPAPERPARRERA